MDGKEEWGQVVVCWGKMQYAAGGTDCTVLSSTFQRCNTGHIFFLKGMQWRLLCLYRWFPVVSLKARPHWDAFLEQVLSYLHPSKYISWQHPMKLQDFFLLWVETHWTNGNFGYGGSYFTISTLQMQLQLLIRLTLTHDAQLVMSNREGNIR